MKISDIYSAAIFDLDGTLADSMRVWDTVTRDWASGLGITATRDLERKISSMTFGESARYLISEFAIEKTTEQVMREWSAMVLESYKKEVEPKPGAVELVMKLAQRMQLAVATSCFPEACEAFLRRHGIRECFSAVVYSDCIGRGKAYPDIYLACAGQLKVSPENCVVFEDLYMARLGARAADMGLIAVYDKASASDWEEFKACADMSVEDFRTLEV